MSDEKVDRQLDLIGKVCPYPTVKTNGTLKKMDPGEVLEVITDYYPTRQTIPNIMREFGYPCKLVDGEKPVFRFIIQKI
ncbi:MAG: sulfurtransferase TusA family protein [Deltaproteobacteria bacterium]|jgi:TusA-related sulfurtransferase|nr:sulfurtransferase TusA family protein [Deltaproteobacteria bacterium]MBW2450320.1 sulfurtransferase TusA family protein [Deltaproteobacteria bacterium]